MRRSSSAPITTTWATAARAAWPAARRRSTTAPTTTAPARRRSSSWPAASARQPARQSPPARLHDVFRRRDWGCSARSTTQAPALPARRHGRDDQSRHGRPAGCRSGNAARASSRSAAPARRKASTRSSTRSMRSTTSSSRNRPRAWGRAITSRFTSRACRCSSSSPACTNEYHRPTDVVDLINFDGMNKIVDMAEDLARILWTDETRPEYVKVGGSFQVGMQTQGAGPSIRLHAGRLQR